MHKFVLFDEVAYVSGEGCEDTMSGYNIGVSDALRLSVQYVPGSQFFSQAEMFPNTDTGWDTFIDRLRTMFGELDARDVECKLLNQFASQARHALLNRTAQKISPWLSGDDSALDAFLLSGVDALEPPTRQPQLPLVDRFEWPTK